jgi:hypothetical protein
MRVAVCTLTPSSRGSRRLSKDHPAKFPREVRGLLFATSSRGRLCTPASIDPALLPPLSGHAKRGKKQM